MLLLKSSFKTYVYKKFFIKNRRKRNQLQKKKRKERNACAQTPPRTCWIRNSGGGARPPGDSEVTKVWESQGRLWASRGHGRDPGLAAPPWSQGTEHSSQGRCATAEKSSAEKATVRRESPCPLLCQPLEGSGLVCLMPKLPQIWPRTLCISIQSSSKVQHGVCFLYQFET